MRRKIRAPRLWDLIILAIVLAVVIFVLRPQDAPLVLYKLALVFLGGVLGYWIDRSLFPYARPHLFLAPKRYDSILASAVMLRRALIVLAAMIGVTLGI